MTTFKIDHDNLTIIATDEHGETHDLNAGCEPCKTTAELTDFALQLLEQGAFGADIADRLRAELTDAA